MNVVGTHLLLELRQCNPALLNDLHYIKGSMKAAADQVGVHVIGESFHQFQPQGVTGILAISESHFCIHTWPEYGYAAADLFTCGTSLDPERAARFLADRLECKDFSFEKVIRGKVPQVLASSS